MSTTTGAVIGLVAGVVLGAGGLMLTGNSTEIDHAGMAMDEMPMTDNPDHDFMAGMVPHHISAVEMAKEVLKTSTDPEVTALAQNILATQQTEIDQMNVWLAANPQ